MTKSDLIDALAQRRQVSIDVAEAVVNAFFEQMHDTLVAGGRIEIRGFGSFKVRHYDGYVGRNPRSMEPVNVPPKRLPVFKPSRLIEARLNTALHASGNKG